MGYQGAGFFRLNADGTHDETFKFNGFMNGRRAVIQPDDKILVLTPRNVQRFMPDGTVDSTFHVSTFNSDCYDLALEPTGTMLVIGSFSTVDGINRTGFARLSRFGILDVFAAEKFFGLPRWLALQSNGDIIVGREHIIRRYFPDGKLDDRFNPPDTANNYLGFGVDKADRVIFNYEDVHTFHQYSGRRRLRLTVDSNFSVVLEQSASLDSASPWVSLKAIGPSSTDDHLLPDVLGPGNAFFRLNPVQ
jgi:hypothetical protein